MLLVYGLAVGVFLGAGRTIPQFMVFIYSGLLAWTLFSTIVTGSITSVVANGALLTRASFPRVLLPLSVLAPRWSTSPCRPRVLLVGYAVFRDLPEPGDLLWLPPALLVLVLLALGVGLALAAVNVYVRDIGFLTDVGLQVGFWLVPVIYSYGQVLRGARVVRLGRRARSPGSTCSTRWPTSCWPSSARCGRPRPPPEAGAFAFPGQLGLRMVVCTVVGPLVAWLGLRVYVKLSGNFGQEL